MLDTASGRCAAPGGRRELRPHAPPGPRARLRQRTTPSSVLRFIRRQAVTAPLSGGRHPQHWPVDISGALSCVRRNLPPPNSPTISISHESLRSSSRQSACSRAKKDSSREQTAEILVNLITSMVTVDAASIVPRASNSVASSRRRRANRTANRDENLSTRNPHDTQTAEIQPLP